MNGVVKRILMAGIMGASIYGGQYTTWFGTANIASRPVCTKISFLAWTASHIKYRIAEVNVARTTNIYFAQSGDDTTGTGTAASPYKTLAKAQLILDASSGDIGLWFNEGDIWRETPKSYIASSIPNGGTTATLSGTVTILPRVGMLCTIRANATGVRQLVSVQDYNSGTKVITFNETVNAAGYNRVDLGQVLFVDKAHVTIGAYRKSGSTNVPGSKPHFTAFRTPYVVGSWTLDAGTTWQTTDAAALTGFAWIRANQDAGPFPLRLATSQANCEATVGSWFASSTTIFVNPWNSEVMNDGDLLFEAVYKNYFEGIVVRDFDDIYINKVMVTGYGAGARSDTTYDGYGIHIYVSGTNRCVVHDCEAYYNGRHSITSTGPSSGGIVTIVGNRCGWLVNDGTPTITYAASGGQYGVIALNQYVGSTLPGTGATYGYGSSGSGYLAHTSGGSNKAAFLLAYKNTFVPGPWQAWGGNFNDTPTFSDLKDCACYIVGEDWSTRLMTNYDPIWSSDGVIGGAGVIPDNNTVVINCKIPYTDFRPNTGGDRSMGYTTGFYINCISILSWEQQHGRHWDTGRFITSGGTLGSVFDGFNFYYGAIVFRVNSPNGGVGIIGKLANTNDAGRDNASYVTATGKIIASVIALDCPNDQATFIVGWNNNAANLAGNAYCRTSYADKTKTYGGYSNDPDIVELSHYYVGPPVGTTMNLVTPRLVAGYRLEYDHDGRPRSQTTARGPFESIANS